MTKTLFLSIATISLLAGCGGGGGDDTGSGVVGTGITTGDTGSEVGDTGITTDEAIQAFTDLNDGFTNVLSNTELQTDLPTTGDAVYNGTLGFDVTGALPDSGGETDASLVGDLTLNVNFQSDTISGSVDNFLFADTDGNLTEPTGSLDVDGEIVSVELTESNQTLEGAIAANATGDLAITRGTTTDDVSLDLTLGGQFGGVEGATSADTPLAAQGGVVGTGTGDLTLTSPNGRFAVQLSGEDLLP